MAAYDLLLCALRARRPTGGAAPGAVGLRHRTGLARNTRGDAGAAPGIQPLCLGRGHGYATADRVRAERETGSRAVAMAGSRHRARRAPRALPRADGSRGV